MKPAMPGELVMSYVGGTTVGKEGWGLSFEVRKLTAGVHFPKDSEMNEVQREHVFEAYTPYRACVYQGATAEAAVGALLLGVALLSRDGSFDPHEPNDYGSPIIQHVISIITERLTWQVARRKEHLDWVRTEGQMPPPQAPPKHYNEAELEAHNRAMLDNVARDNEIIAALSTSLAALARVKDL